MKLKKHFRKKVLALIILTAVIGVFTINSCERSPVPSDNSSIEESNPADDKNTNSPLSRGKQYSYSFISKTNTG